MNYSNFKYFINTYIGYCIGIIVTLLIMVLFNHAQPALLYLVPGVLITSTCTSILNGEFKARLLMKKKLRKKNIKKDDK